MALLANHRQYRRHEGLEYILRSGGAEGKSGSTGAWSKRHAFKDKLEEELAKPRRQRVEWIL